MQPQLFLAQIDDLGELLRTPNIGAWDFVLDLFGSIIGLIFGLAIILSLVSAAICFAIGVIVSSDEIKSAKWFARAKTAIKGFIAIGLVAIFGELVLGLWDGLLNTVADNI